MIRPGGEAKRWIFLISGLSCLVIAFGLVTAFRETAPIEEITPFPADDAVEPPREETAEKWAVYVTGEVAFPGVYEIEPGSRVRDAVELAGGFSRNADAAAVNLAAKLRDEAHVSVPSVGAAPEEPGLPKPDPARKKDVSSVSYPNGAAEERQGSKIDINTADASLLSTLPGIGPKLSAAIVAHREEHGRFSSVEDLRSVKGIGAKRLESIRSLIEAAD
jgi:competence protein ComEA